MTLWRRRWMDATDSTWDRRVIAPSRSGVVLVELWSPGRRGAAPVIELASHCVRHIPTVSLVRVNADISPRIVQAVMPCEVPALVAIVNGEVRGCVSGVATPVEVCQFVDETLAQHLKPAATSAQAGTDVDVGDLAVDDLVVPTGTNGDRDGSTNLPASGGAPVSGADEGDEEENDPLIELTARILQLLREGAVQVEHLSIFGATDDALADINRAAASCSSVPDFRERLETYTAVRKGRAVVRAIADSYGKGRDLRAIGELQHILATYALTHSVNDLTIAHRLLRAEEPDVLARWLSGDGTPDRGDGDETA